MSAGQRAKLPKDKCCHCWSGQRSQVPHGLLFYLASGAFSTGLGAEHSSQCPLPKHTAVQASQACPPPEVAPESRLKTPWSAHGLRENYFSVWNGLVKHRDENFYHDTNCFILFCHNFTVPFIQWFLLTHEKGMKRGSIFVTFSHIRSIRYHNSADEKREKY